MKVVIAIDSFKGSLSSLQAGTAAATGIYRVDPKVETRSEEHTSELQSPQ